MSEDAGTLLDELVAVLPRVTPYQFAVYVFLLRSAGTADSRVIKIGKRTIVRGLGRGARSSHGNLQHIDEKLRELHDLGLIRVGVSDRLGTEIEVKAPTDVEWVVEALGQDVAVDVTPDYFRDADARRQLFERDKWRCRYCGETVTELTATLDHVVPQCAGGGDDPGNLATACHGCNSVKSGRTEAEAAPLLLARLRDSAMRRS